MLKDNQRARPVAAPPPEEPATAHRPERWQPVAILALFLLLALYYGRNFPPFEGPDEPQHFAYITWLVQQGNFPPQGDAAWETPMEQEAGQPPLYYLLASLPARLAGFDPPAEYRPNPHFIGPFPRDNIDNDHRAIREPGDARPLRGGWLALYLARGVTLLFGLMLVGGVYLLGREVWPGRSAAPLFAATLVALTPQVLFLSTVASNDIPAAALSTFTLWRLVVLLRRSYTPGRAILTGIFLGLAVLTKVSALVLALPLAVGLLWQGWETRRNAHPFPWLRAGLLAAGGALLVAGWWFLRNWQRYGSPLGLTTHDRTSWAIRDPAELASPYLRWLEVFRSYWAGLGWGTIRPSGWVYSLLLVLVLVAVLGWVWALRRRRERPAGQIMLYVLCVLTLLGVMIFLEVWMRRVSAPYGRLLFPAIGAITLLLVGGWRQWHPALPLLPLAVLGLLTTLAPPLIIRPAYTPPPPLPPAEAAALSELPGWRFVDAAGQPVVDILRVAPLVNNIDTVLEYDQTLPVEVCWRALAQSEQPYTLFLHVIGPENELVANRRTYPGLGLWPTTQWPVGAVVCDLVGVLIRTERVQETLAYQLEVGFLDEATDTRLPILDAAGNAVPVAFAARVRLAAPNTPHETLSATDPLPLLDHEVQRTWTPGRDATLTLTWGVAAPVAVDYQTFVHLRDPQTGENVANGDGPPLAGWYGTSWWTTGEIITDTRTFPVPADLRPDSYTLVVGFYDLTTGQRFGNEYDLGTVEVR